MKAFVSVLLLFLSFGALAQNEDVIEGLTATEFNGKVLLTWSVKAGKTCNGIEILHSLDSVNFTEIGSIEGICGSSQSSISYDFTHIDPNKNTVNYYRLHLGGTGFSWIVEAEVLDLAGSNYLLRPNPVTDFSELFFDNETAATHHLEVVGTSGKVAFTAETNGELFILSSNDIDPGLYFFAIRKEGEDPKITGKFLVY